MLEDFQQTQIHFIDPIFGVVIFHFAEILQLKLLIRSIIAQSYNKIIGVIQAVVVGMAQARSYLADTGEVFRSIEKFQSGVWLDDFGAAVSEPFVVTGSGGERLCDVHRGLIVVD